MSYDYKTPSENVRLWNNRMGNGPVMVKVDKKETLKKMFRQISFVLEEAKEMFDAAEENDIVEILDAHLDLKFVNDQIGVYLEALGVNVKAAWDEVCYSNDTKFTNDPNESREGCELVLVEGTGEKCPPLFLLKRISDGKIMKPSCFVEPDLVEYIPKDLLDN